MVGCPCEPPFRMSALFQRRDHELSLSNFRALRLVQLVLFVAFLAGCSSQPKTSNSPHPKQVTEWRSDLEYFSRATKEFSSNPFWQYSAKIGLRSNSIKESANLVWQVSDQTNNIRLFGPLGMGAIKLQFDSYGVELQDNDGKVHHGANAQALLTDIIGWPLPIEALPRWLFLQPDPSQPFQYRLNDVGQLDAIRQYGWQINYSNYRDYNGRTMPRTLAAKKQFDETELGLVSVKLITKEWQQ